MHTNKKRGYARSFGAQLNYQNRRFAGWAKNVGGFGRAYKASVKAAYPAFMQFTPYGEMLPNAQSYVDLDRERTDKFGLPQARRHVRWGANEEALFNDMVRWSLEMLEKAGAEILTVPDGPAPNHELGGCRMGRDPRTLGRQRRLPHARCAEPLRGRWQRVSVGVREESDAHDHGAGRARRRSHRRTDAKR